MPQDIESAERISPTKTTDKMYQSTGKTLMSIMSEYWTPGRKIGDYF